MHYKETTQVMKNGMHNNMYILNLRLKINSPARKSPAASPWRVGGRISGTVWDTAERMYTV
jgi:hypothetical protein